MDVVEFIQKVIAYFGKEGATITQAPVSFLTSIVIIGGILWKLMHWRFEQKIDMLQQELQLWKAKIENADPVLPQIVVSPTIPDPTTFMRELGHLSELLGEEFFGAFPSDEVVSLYRKLEQDFRSVQADVNEDSRKFIEQTLSGAREELIKKIKDL